jgi:membrane protein DedA with SNARE-associated domain
MVDPVAGSTFAERLMILVEAQQHGLGPLLLGASALVEYLFPPYPGEMIVLFGAFLVARRGWSLPVWATVVLLGSFIGVCALYGVGRWLRVHRPQLTGRLGRIQAQIDALIVRFEHRATLWLFLNRFVPSVRWMIIVAAGMAGVPARRALPASFVSAILWNGCVLVCGHLLGASWERVVAILGELGRLSAVLVVVAVVVVAGWLLVRARRRADGDQA